MKITETVVHEFELDKIGIERVAHDEFRVAFETKKSTFDMYDGNYITRHSKTFARFDEALEFLLKYVGELK